MPSFASALETTLHKALEAASARRHEYATLEHLLFALVDDEHASQVMTACGVDLGELKTTVAHYLDTELGALKVDQQTDPSPTSGFQRVVQRAILHVQSSGRDEVTGASTFRLEKGLDTGPVFGVLTETIRPTDTSGDLLGRLADAGSGLLLSTLDGLEAGELAPEPQPTTGVSHAPKVEVEDARIRWELPAHIIYRLVRAYTPAPGPWTSLDDARIKVGPVSVASADDPGLPDAARDGGLAPGALAVTKKAVFVGTGSQPVKLGTVQPPGKKPMPAADWARGARLTDGTVLG